MNDEDLLLNICEKQINCIKKLQLGFVENNEIDLFILNMILHCADNKEIFTTKQFNNLNDILTIILNRL